MVQNDIHPLISSRNDNVPEFSSKVYTAAVSEDAAVMSEVTIVTATDGDENDVITYSIVDGGECVAFPQR